MKASDLHIARAVHFNASLRAPEPDLDAGFEAFLTDLPEDPESDETWNYMIDLLDDGEISASEFRRQMLSAGYDENQIATAIASSVSE